MKHLLALASIALVILTLSACDKSEAYNKDLTVAADTISARAGLSAAVCDIYATQWAKAIDDGKDFNDALANARAILDTKVLPMAKAGKVQVDSMMQRLNDVPEKSKAGHDKVMELYGVYTKLHSLAMSPSGSMISFNAQRNTLYSDVERLRNELRVMNVMSKEAAK